MATPGSVATSGNFMDDGDEDLGNPFLTGTGGMAPTGYVPGEAARQRDASASAARTANTNRLVDPNASQASGATQAGNIGGASGAYNTASDSGRAQYDYMHDLGDNDFIKTPGGLINDMGERVGVSHAGDVVNPLDSLDIINPFTGDMPGKDILDRAMDPNTGLGSTRVGAGGARGGKPVTNLSPGTRDAAGAFQDLDTSLGAVVSGDTSIGIPGIAGMGGGSEPSPFDTSGSDRGGLGLGGAYADTLQSAANNAVNSRTLGNDVLSGKRAPGGAGQAQQGDALDAAMGFASGPRAATGVMGQVDQFLGGPEGPSKAQLLLQDAAQGSMADNLSMARSGRARDAGSQARAMNIALAENAATGVDTARSAGLLRAQEAADAKNQQLQGLGLKGNLAQGVDTGTLGALGLGGDIASALRSGNIQERGQNLNFAQGQDQIGASQQASVLDTIPKLEQVRHSDQFSLTPQQQLEAARIGGPQDKTTADYVTALLGDVLGVL